jgi:hypothetical protein
MSKVKRKPKLHRLMNRLRLHLKTDPSRLPVLEQNFARYERPNLHLALEEMLRELPRAPELVGVISYYEHEIPRLARLSHPATGTRFFAGAVEYRDVPQPGGQRLACIKQGLYLLEEKDGPLVMLIAYNHRWDDIVVEVMAAQREIGEQFLRRLTRQVERGKAFTGHILSIEEDCQGTVSVNYHNLPPVCRDDIILPPALMQRIERHTISFTRHAEKLRRLGRHLKRGILLHGPPGTGKTLTAMYLASQMNGRTVLLMTGSSVRAIESACKLARMLTPATIILEDVDLIGTEREYQSIGANALLFELLNQMDGLSADADLLFVLTTNRPDILEPALAARPGRIDQAIELPLPDLDCRRRLLKLYGRGLKTQNVEWNQLSERIDGASGAFIRELLRKAAVFAAEDSSDGELVIGPGHIDEALTELVVAGGALTQSLLGSRNKAASN